MGDKLISYALMAGVVSSLVSVFFSGLFFAAAIFFWVWNGWRNRQWRLETPPFTVFLLAFCTAVLVSILFSTNPLDSAIYLKKLIKFFYVFLIFTFFTRVQVEQTLHGIFAVLGLSALYGILQYYWLMEVNLLNRINGFMSHWMTFSGQLMLGSVALAGYILLYRLSGEDVRETNGEREEGSERWGERWTQEENSSSPKLKTRTVKLNFDHWGLIFWIGVLVLLLFALVLTNTRSAWLGAVVGLSLLLAIYRFRWLIIAGIGLIGLFFLLPTHFQQRLYSSFDPRDTTTRGRLELLQTGKNMVWTHPWTGVGPRMVPFVYHQYAGESGFPHWMYQHLHSTPIHVAAEMGLVALGLWIALWLRLLYDFTRFAQTRLRDNFPFYLAVNGILVLVAFLLAGLFEYNFGDSEILVLLLFLMTAPYASKRRKRQAT